MDVSGTTDLNLGILQLGDTLDLSAERAHRLGQSGEACSVFAFPHVTADRTTTQPQADDPELRHRVRAVVIFYTWRVGGGARSTILTINTVHVILYFFAPQKKRMHQWL